MLKTTRAPTAVGSGYLEVTEGATPSSLEVSMNARGLYQYTVKLYIGEPTVEALEAALATVQQLDRRFRRAIPTPAGHPAEEGETGHDLAS
jgi:hypothetical protein